MTSVISSLKGGKKELDFPAAMKSALGSCQHCACRKNSQISSLRWDHLIRLRIKDSILLPHT